MARVDILPEADSDLEEQATYLGHEASLDVALRFYDAVQVSFDLLARNPHIGVQRDSKRPELAGIRIWRVTGFEKHLIFYRPLEDGIEVVRVIHGQRDLESILGPEGR